jgi:drug/metabolite transporter (DMT)-like permease
MRIGHTGSRTGNWCTAKKAPCREAQLTPAYVNPILEASLRPLAWIGVVLIVAGIVVVAMRGIQYTKSRNEVDVGPLKVTSQERGLVPPIAGIVAIVAGAVLVFAGRKSSV